MSYVPSPTRRVRWFLRRRLPSASAGVLFIVLLILSATRSSSFLSSSGLAGSMSEVAPLVLATLSVSAIALAGPSSVDLSIGPLIVFVNVVIVQWFVPSGLDSPVVLILLSIALAIAFECAQGFVIARLRLQPVIITLAGFLVLSGLDLVILPQPGGTVPAWLSGWGAPTGALSAPLWVMLAALLGWGLLGRTTAMKTVRLVGANERTAYVSGLPLIKARVIAHAVGGVFAGLSGLMLCALLESGDATQASGYTLQVLAALVLGGASLAGGRASAVGAVLGALDIYLISFALGTYNFGAKSSYVVQFSTGIVLVLALAGATGLIALGELRRRRARQTREA